MSVMCPNCGQETKSRDCQWCHYPLTGSRPARAKVAQRTNRKSGMAFFGWLVMIPLALVIVTFVFLHFSPDYNLYLVRSESMKPAINLGDMIITGPVNGPWNGEIESGTIVTYEHGKALVTHRVLSIDGERLVMKVDSAEDPDPWSVYLSDVRGIYLFKIPYIGYVPNFVQTKLGWFLVIIAPATLLVALLTKDIVKEALSDS